MDIPFFGWPKAWNWKPRGLSISVEILTRAHEPALVFT